MNEKALRSLIEPGGVKQLRIIADGSLFHIDVATTKKGSITATTAKGMRTEPPNRKTVRIPLVGNVNFT